MFKYEINLGKDKLELQTSAATAIYYKQVFHEDLLVFMLVDANKDDANDAQAVEVAQKLCFIMKSQAESANMKTLTFDSYVNWLETVDQMDLIRAAFDILAVFKGEMKGLSTPKKKDEEQSAE